jgi:hypothetical protein
MKNSIFFTLFFLFSFSASLFAQTQIGQKIIGEAANDRSGTSVSMPDSKTIAIGAPNNNGGLGHVRVFQLQGGIWVQKGGDVDGQVAGDIAGVAVSMPHPNVLAVGASGYNSRNGRVFIYRWNGLSWVPKGQTIIDTIGGNFGTSISMPDTNTIAIGAPEESSGNGNGAGHVRIYKWNGSSWVPKGQDILGENLDDIAGWSVSMPDSNTVAIGAPYHDRSGFSFGQVRIFRWNGTSWIQKGLGLYGNASFDRLGWSVSMPDSNTVAAGVPYVDGGGGSDIGSVHIYRWDGSSWIPKGNEILGEAADDMSGISISMGNSDIIAIGAYRNYANFYRTGQVRIYRWIGSGWVQDGSDYDGDGSQDNFGTSVCMPDAYTFASGAIEQGFMTFDPGYTKVFSLCNSANVISPKVCRDYLSPSGKYTWTNTGQYIDTILNANSCDSILTINLTVPKINTTVSNFSTSIASNQFNAVYQWLDCDSSFAPISGATNQIFTPSKIGNYAVMVTAYGCVDTSACENISTVGIVENVLSLTQVFPNPSDGAFTVKLGSNNLNVNLKVNSMDGKIIHQEANLNANQLYIDLSKYPKGVYFVTIQNQEAIKVIKLVRK